MVKSGATAARLLKTVGLAGSLWVGSVVVAHAATIFSEDFSGSAATGYNTGSSGGTGVIGGSQFKVTSGDVDVIGPPPSYGCVADAAANCLDLIGSSGQGTVTSTSGIDLHAGNSYTIAYTDVFQGFAAGPTPSLNYSVSLGSHVFNTASTPTVTPMSFMFTAVADELGALLTFTTLQNLDYVHGPVISGITVNETVAATPVPATLPLFASGLGVLGFLNWRRRRAAV